MAKPLYSVKFTSNFRFSKLSSQLDDILGSNNESIIDSLAQITKRNISDGKLRRLSQSTIEMRQLGGSTFKNHNTSPTSETRPLLYTGRLLKSIKPVKDGIEMLEYGEFHNDGFRTPNVEAGFGKNKSVPPRRFIAGADDLKRDKKELEKTQDDLVKKMNKAMLKTSR